MTKDAITQGAILLLLGEFMLAIMAALIKQASAQVEPEVLVFIRNLFGLLFLLPIVTHRGWRNLKTHYFSLHLLRSVTGLSAMYCYFYVITHLPLAEAALVKLSAPFFLPLIALIWLNEGIDRKTLWAIMVGFLGVMVVLRPGAATFQPVALIGILGAALASTAKVSIRRMATHEPSYRIVFYFGLLATLVSAIPLTWAWQTPPADTWLWLIGTGLTGTCGQLFMTKAYQVANPGKIGPYTYTAVIYAAALGWFFWDETVVITTFIGSLLIVGAGIFNLKSGSKTL